MNWQHTQTSGVSLHDCRATSMHVTDNHIEFIFEDGFLVLADNEHNPHGKVCRSNVASLVIREYDLESIYIFRNFHMFGRRILTVRRSIDLNRLAEMLNSGKRQLEFITTYISDFTVLCTCEIWSDRKPYHRECLFETVYESIEYNWNATADNQ
ncbi:MAG: hypothetical protein E7554_02225 [Ruminococcaceae bacterium]|nr:hypothetical protein [Oscillospiraceae bacterium]